MELWPRPIQGFLNAIQAVAEATILKYPVSDAATSAFQAAVILGIVAGLSVRQPGALGGRSAVQAAGGGDFRLYAPAAYLLRCNLPFSSLRPVGWYYAIPQSGPSVRSRLVVGSLHGVSRAGGKLTVRTRASCCWSWSLWDSGRSRRKLHIEAAPPLAPSESGTFWRAYMRNAGAAYLNAESSEHLRRTLARLDRAEQIAPARASVKRRSGASSAGSLVPGISKSTLQTRPVCFEYRKAKPIRPRPWSRKMRRDREEPRRDPRG